MEVKKILLLLAVFVAVLIPWYFLKYQKGSHERCVNDFFLIRAQYDPDQLSICSAEEFDRLLYLLEQHLPEVKFLRFLSREEQEATCKKLLKEYVLVPYVVSEMLKKDGFSSDQEFIKNRDLYLRIMENNFNISVFRDNVAKNIVISDDMAKRYYLENQKKLFNVPPFAKEIGGIAAQIIPITDHQKSLKDLASLFSNKKDGFTIEGFFPELENSHVDEIFKKALIEMKIGQIRVVSLDGQFFAIKKIRDANGLWNDYDQVAEKVQYVLKKELIDKKCAELIADYEEKLKIEVCQKGVADYIENKVNEFKGIIDYVENDLQELEASGEKNTINESSVKEVIQKEVEIV